MTTTEPIRDGRRYRRLILGLVTVGVAGLLVGMGVQRTLAGLVVYALAVVGAFGTLLYARLGSSVALQDEREAALERRASHVTIQLFGYLGLFAFVALFLLDATGARALGAAEETLLYAYAAISLTWGAVYLWLRYRP